ncbi:MAG: short-chain dehydrogenase [Thalassobium sp.]|uniref:SDR family oxidoreductase n=1 Tax=Octadecabacter sp. SW4 TaxID=2602067 RepID=UPI000C0E32D5|nr:SDR family oxidoreductase [Octadecabacter sp. SW4]PHQ86005.1 MAG: short-chain dehydrogenase [Thalassobium sp.]QEE36970.1 SDR family oxidoreductase [Octadecabacter sp. SW4]
MDMTDQAVMITGASRGIGAAAARAFAAQGARVALLARSAEALAALAADIGPNAIAIACDVSDRTSMGAAVDKTLQRFGRLDVFVGNAGVIDPIGQLADTDPDAWGALIDVNLKGVFHGMHAVLPVMQKQGRGTIITISSGAAHGPVEGWSAYCSSKAGAYMLTRVADKEYRQHGVRVLGLSPGTVATDMQREIKDSGINPVSQLDWSDHIAPEWPAQALVWMCSPAADGFLGDDISLRDPEIRRTVGLI